MAWEETNAFCFLTRQIFFIDLEKIATLRTDQHKFGKLFDIFWLQKIGHCIDVTFLSKFKLCEGWEQRLEQNSIENKFSVPSVVHDAKVVK